MTLKKTVEWFLWISVGRKDKKKMIIKDKNSFQVGFDIFFVQLKRSKHSA